MNLKDCVIFEDNNLLIINKPRGVLVQNDGSDGPSLDLLVKEAYPNLETGPIHRLDKDTSGLVIFGKNQVALKDLSNIIQNKEYVEKHYVTLVIGELNEDGFIDAPIRKNFQLKKMVVAPIKSGAKEAKTQYKIIEKFAGYSLLDVTLLTGRTHQIRVHMSYIRHHVVGDDKYGDFKVNNLFKKTFAFKGQFLHSYKLTFKQIKGKLSYLSNKEFIAEMPDEYKNIIEFLKANNLEIK